MLTKRCFAPVVNTHTRLLILGSLPGEASLQAGRYYAHPQNQFWRLLGGVLGQELAALPYAERLALLLAHGIGLWDVVAEAQRSGSLDSDIRAVQGNDLAGLLAELPALGALAFNGQKAAAIGLRQLGALAPRYTIHTLPSSSPAHTLALSQKLTAWQALRANLDGA